MADHDALEAYCSALEAERQRRGLELELLTIDGLDIPDDRIAAEGFAGLSDDQLADIALSPEAIRAIEEHLDDTEVEVGPWYFDALRVVGDARPEAAENARRAVEVYERLRDAGLLGAGKASTVARSSSHTWFVRSPLARRAAYAIAASLLIGMGVLIGSMAFHGIATATGMEILVAIASPQFVPARGTDTDLRVEIQCDRPGFATVMSLASGRRQQVLPLPGADPISVASSGTTTYGPLPPDSTTVLVVVTELPATDAIRNALLGKQFTPNESGQLQGFLRDILGASGHRWAAFGITRFERPPKG
jgi:hypothetical protein